MTTESRELDSAWVTATGLASTACIGCWESGTFNEVPECGGEDQVRTIVLVSPDRLGPEMAGAGIRTFELGRALAGRFDVRILAPEKSMPMDDSPPVSTYELGGSLRDHLSRGDVVVAPPLPPTLLRGLGTRPWIVDLYNPEPFEGLEHQKARHRRERKARDVLRIDRIAFAARRGNAFISASERQRDMWLGFLAASRRLDSDLYSHDPDLRLLIDVVPFGVPDEPPTRGDPVVRGPVLPEDARILMWHGGIWDWLDPLTPIRSLKQLRHSDPRWVLVFNGTERPSHRGDMQMVRRARALATELGLEQAGAVYFRPGWTPYAQRGNLLLEGDVGLSCHLSTLEARFAARTRILDYVWAGLPIVATQGDEWAEKIEREGLGVVIPPADTTAFTEAVERVVERGRAAYAPALASVASRLHWEDVSRPLVRLIENTSTSRRRDPVMSFVAARHAAATFLAKARDRATP
jgi:glycosyltransferase involved in cell wall biosynthesis